MKTLYLVRHAKSSWDDASLSDKQRPLNKRGHDNALTMGQRLNQRSQAIEYIISSPALRALTTARYLADAIEYDQEDIQIEQQMYFCGIQSMLDLVHACDPEISSLMLVGHNPDMTEFFNFLCGHQTANMPTAAIARIEFDLAWAQIKKGSGTLLDYDYPKKD